MAFTVGDFNDLKRLLATHPEWRAELRDLLLTEDFQALPGLVRDLVEAQRRTEQRMAESQARTDQRFAELAEAQRRTEQRVAELAEAQRELAEAQSRTNQRLAELAEGQHRLAEAFRRTEDIVGRLQGDSLEIRYRLNAGAFFGRWLRGTKVIGGNELVDRVESQLSPDEVNELLLTDLVVRGRVARLPERPEVWLAVEISVVVDHQNVARAVRRAELLRRAGLPALPVVVGAGATLGAESEAGARGVAMLRDGTGRFWNEAIAAWPV